MLSFSDIDHSLFPLLKSIFFPYTTAACFSVVLCLTLSFRYSAHWKPTAEGTCQHVISRASAVYFLCVHKAVQFLVVWLFSFCVPIIYHIPTIQNSLLAIMTSVKMCQFFWQRFLTLQWFGISTNILGRGIGTHIQSLIMIAGHLSVEEQNFPFTEIFPFSMSMCLVNIILS